MRGKLGGRVFPEMQAEPWEFPFLLERPVLFGSMAHFLRKHENRRVRQLSPLGARLAKVKPGLRWCRSTAWTYCFLLALAPALLLESAQYRVVPLQLVRSRWGGRAEMFAHTPTLPGVTPVELPLRRHLLASWWQMPLFLGTDHGFIHAVLWFHPPRERLTGGGR